MRLVYIVGLLFIVAWKPGFSMADGLMDALAGKSKPSPASSAPAPQPAPVAAPKPAPVPPAPVAPVSPPIVPAKENPPVKKPADPPPVKAAVPAPATDMSESQPVSPPKSTNRLSDEDERLLGLVKNKRVETLRADVEEERKRRRVAEAWDPQSSLQGQGAANALKPITVYAIEIRGKTRRALIGYGTKSAAWYTVGSHSSVRVASITEDTVIGRYLNAERRWEDFQGSVYDVAAYPASAYPGAPGGAAVPGQATMTQPPSYPVR